MSQQILTKIKIGLTGTQYDIVDQTLRAEISGKAEAISLGPCKNIRCIQQGTNVRIKWEDPGNVVINNKTFAYQDSTVLVRKEGSYPSGVNDGTVVKTSQVLNQFITNPYIDVVPDESTTYYYQLFPKSTQSVYNTSQENRFESNSINWNTVHEIVSAGLASSYFSLGDILTTHHTTYGDIEWLIVDFDHPWTFADGQEHHSITLWSRYTLDSVQFDAAEDQYAITDDTIFMQQTYLKYTQGSNTWYFVLQDSTASGNDRVWITNNGTYKLYYTSNKWTIIQVSTKTVITYQTTLTQDPWDSSGVWSNSCTFTLWKKYYTLSGEEYSEATVTNHAAVTANTYYEQLPDILFGQTSNNRKNYGYNRWSQSGARQYFNSDKVSGTYYVKQNIFDKQSSQMSQNGFMYRI